MYYYKLYGLRIASDLELCYVPELPEQERGLEPELIIEERALPEGEAREPVCYSVIRKEKCILANSYCFLYIEQGRRLYYEKKETATLTRLNGYILGWGIAMVFYQRGKTSIHCSCVSGDEGAVLISGNSGSGKSTITGELLKRGYTLMADDVAVVWAKESGEIYASPAFPYRKVCRNELERMGAAQDSAVYIDEDKDKFLVPYGGGFSTDSRPVHALFLLKFGAQDEVSITEAVGAEKFTLCMEAVFLAPLLGKQLYEPEIGVRMLDFASKVPVYVITRPVNKDTRDEVVKKLMSVL